MASNGVDYYRNHVGADIDFTTHHIYTDFWWPRESWSNQLGHFRKWNNAHALVRVKPLPPPSAMSVRACRSGRSSTVVTWNAPFGCMAPATLSHAA